MTFKISDSINNFLAFDLSEMLNALINPESFNYKIYYYEYIGINKGEFELDYSNTPKILTYKDFLKFKEEILQTLNCEIIGQFNSNVIKINCFDSDFWTMETNDLEIINRLKQNFKEIEEYNI